MSIPFKRTVTIVTTIASGLLSAACGAKSDPEDNPNNHPRPESSASQTPYPLTPLDQVEFNEASREAFDQATKVRIVVKRVSAQEMEVEGTEASDTLNELFVNVDASSATEAVTDEKVCLYDNKVKAQSGQRIKVPPRDKLITSFQLKSDGSPHSKTIELTVKKINQAIPTDEPALGFVSYTVGGVQVLASFEMDASKFKDDVTSTGPIKLETHFDKAFSTPAGSTPELC